MSTGRFINLAEYLLQQAVQEEERSKDRAARSARLWANGSRSVAEHFREQADFFAARSEELFSRAIGYENTAGFLATPTEAVSHIVVAEHMPDLEAA